MSFFSTIISQTFNGLQAGSVYALIALGYSMVYGIIMLLNFAHGDIIMVGAYIAWIMLTVLGLPPVIGVVAAIAGCILLGVTIEKVAYAPASQIAAAFAAYHGDRRFVFPGELCAA